MKTIVEHTESGSVQRVDIRINTCMTSSCALEMPSECSSWKSFRGSMRSDMMMELMNRELEQLSRHVTDITCTGVSV